MVCAICLKLKIKEIHWPKIALYVYICKVTLFHFEDDPRPGVAEVISTLRKKAKLRIMMLTGDHESSALRVAKAVGIDEVYSSLKPEDKLNKVKNASRDIGNCCLTNLALLCSL